ncbi:MAG: pentapeptide repeat-containing protein [Acutalibacteraceae bacterium]
MRRQTPQLCVDMNTRESALDVLINADMNELDVRNYVFFDETIEGLNISDVEISGCIFRNCKFRNCQFEGVSFNNCVFESCDLSLLYMSQGSIMRTEIKNSKILGINLTFGIVNNVLFESTVCRFANFSEVRFTNTEFKDCDMNSASMDKCRVKQLAFSGCDLSGTNFCHTPLKSVDLRGNEINGMVFVGGELEGAVVDTAQAIGLVKLLGVEVKD